MYYTDIGFKGNTTDSMFFMNIILTSIHTNKKFKFALSFPQFKKGVLAIAQNKNFDNFYASSGKILRLFSDDKSKLENFLNLNIITDFKKQNILINTKPIEVPIVNKYEYYVREQIDSHIRDVKKRLKNKDFKVVLKNEIIEKDFEYWSKRLKTLEKKKQEEQINIFYIKTYSNSQNSNFSLFIKREISDISTNNFNPSNYGLSQVDNVTYLPIFPSNLDL